MILPWSVDPLASACRACLLAAIVPVFLVAHASHASPEITVYTGAGVVGNERTSDSGVFNFIPTATGSSSATQTFTIENAGATPLTISSVSLAGLDSSQFTLVTTGLSTTIESGGITTFTVAFSPTLVRLRQARIEIASDDADESPFRIHVAGQGRNIQPRPVAVWDDDGIRNSRHQNVQDGVDVVAGSVHSLVLRSNGTLIGEGLTPPSGLSNIVAISAGARHDLALKSDGTVVAWGINTRDHLTSVITNQSIVPAGLNGVAAVQGGYSHSLVLKNDGTVLAWGDIYEDQCAVPAGLNDVVALAAGGAHSLALKRDGTVVGWGTKFSNNGQATVPAGLTDVVAIAAGYRHSLALKRNGTVVAWGANTFGQINVPTSMTNVAAISSQSFLNLSLKSDGTVVSWGYLGTFPVPFGLSDVVAMAPGFYCFALGAFPELALYQGASPTGSRFYGNTINLGVVRASAPSTTQPFTIRNEGTAALNISSIGLGGADPAAFALDTSGVPTSLAPGATATFNLAVIGIGAKSATLTIASNDPSGASFVITVTATGTSFVTAYKGTSTVGLPWKNNQGVHNFPPTAVLASSAAQTYTLRNAGTSDLSVSSITLDGAHAGDFSIGGFSPDSLPPGGSTTFTVTFTPAQSGLRRARIRIMSDDSDEPAFYLPVTGRGVGRPTEARPVVAWGLNSMGQTQVPANLSEAVAVAAGNNHTLALKSDGTVVAWGQPGYGQLVVPAGLSGVIAVAAGVEHSVALKADGTVVSWGRTDGAAANVPEGLSSVVAVAAGGATSVALKSDGSVVVWGTYAHTLRAVPPGVSGVVAVAVGINHILALKRDGTVVGWGSNAQNQCLIPAGLNDAVGLSAGAQDSTALRADGTLLSWGFYNQPPANMGRVWTLDSGSEHALAVQENGVVFAWGNHGNGRNTVPAGLVDAVAVAAGENHNVVLARQVKALPQTITFNAPATLYMGQTVKLEAWASSGLPVSFAPIDGPNTLSGDMITASQVATVKVAAVQYGGGAYQAAPRVIRTIAFKSVPAPVTSNSTVLTLVNFLHVYDGNPKAVSVLGAGAAVPVITYNGSAQAPTNAGKYAVKASVTPASGKAVTVSGTLTIDKAPLYVRSEDQRRLVSQANPILTFGYAGFRGTDTAAVIQKAPEISTTAKATSLAGLYPITTKGGTASNYVFVHLPGTLVVDGFGLGYEALLSDTNGRAAGKLEVTLNATCTSFTAKVASISDTTVVSFSGPMTMNPLTGLASGAKTVTFTKPSVVATHALQFTVTQDGTLNATYGLTLGSHPAWILQPLPGHGRRLLPKPVKPLPYAGAYTFLMEPAQPAPDLPASRVPPASGWAVATVSTAGVLTLTGVLGDGTSFTTALKSDLAADPGYRFFLQTSKPVRIGTFVGGVLSLAGHYRYYNSKHIAEATLHWAKFAEAKDPTYPEGFENLNVTAILDPWIPPTKDIDLVSRLGPPGDSMPLKIYHGSTGNWNVSPPYDYTLNIAGKLTVTDAQNNPCKWQTTLNAATGQFAGSFEAPEAPNKKRTIKFTGILRQPTFSWDTLLGGGQFILPPRPGSPAGQKSTTVDMTIMKPDLIP